MLCFAYKTNCFMIQTKKNSHSPLSLAPHPSISILRISVVHVPIQTIIQAWYTLQQRMGAWEAASTLSMICNLV